MTTTNKTTTAPAKFFLARIYCMYDGKEFPTVDLIVDHSLEDATNEAENRCATAHYSFSDIDEVNESGYWSDCGAHVVRVKSVTEISAATYEEIKNLL
ncbi:hypothetical protein GAP31_049 [Cronobacter phage vB_CsaM_GAP31]|uniref:Uncharacterized protein n=1 Tax=Cronobacter phage vB_CsaM_GAP31 TaxID=1141135 RepID=K4F953_9CAUD|nr:hypothetical protein GAP31_049 [Cronobacter phage vB_CsaM_GAP31]AFC21230.1 hypothetical protein GAP31_049 [Cronobacter phage vB_CsaM_GAP31]